MGKRSAAEIAKHSLSRAPARELLKALDAPSDDDDGDDVDDQSICQPEKVMTPFGRLMQTMNVDCKDGSTSTITYIHPVALLYGGGLRHGIRCFV